MVVVPVVPEPRLEPVSDFLVEVPVLLLVPDFFVPACELLLAVVVLAVVVVAVSLVLVHEVPNATATAALRVRRRDFFIGGGWIR